MMQIQNGKLYENKSWFYLYPCLNSYGPELMKHLKLVFKINIGVKDNNVKIEEEPCIYILVDTNIRLLNDRDIVEYKLRFTKFLDWVKYQSYYVTDYMFEATKGLHMVVLKIPEEHKETYKYFTKGEYSKMYTKEQIIKYYPFVNLGDPEKEKKSNGVISGIRAVLNRNKNGLPAFVKIVNEKFNTHLTVDELSHIELEFPPTLKEEIFNYE